MRPITPRGCRALAFALPLLPLAALMACGEAPNEQRIEDLEEYTEDLEERVEELEERVRRLEEAGAS